MKLLTFSILLMLPFLGYAQNSNIFLDRSFWKSSPDVETVKAMIQKGNDPIALNGNAFDAVVYAILEDAPFATIQYLLSLEGNPVDKVTHDGRNYLMWAAYKGNLEVMKYLVEQGSDTKIVDDHGYTTLTFAANAGQQNKAVYDYILANGGNINETNRSGANALLLLAPSLKGDVLIHYFVKKGIDLHAQDADGNGIFNYATRKGNLKLLAQLIEMGVDYKSLNQKGGNAMLFAARGSRGYSNPVEVYEYLYNLGLEADIVNAEGKTPLHQAAGSTKDPAVIDFFVDKGVNVNQVDKDGNTAFLNALRSNNLAIAKKLALGIRNINHANKDGYTAMTYAIMRNSVEAFNFLLKQGAKTDVVDQKGRDLLYHSFNSYQAKNQEAFLAFGKVLKPVNGMNMLPHLAVEKGEKFLLEKAIEMGADINQKNKDGLTPLHIAAMKAQDQELLALLLEKGADKKILTEFEESAYDLAAENEALSQKGMNLEFLKIER